ncbi:MAG TPA: antibiotic biosynthesis monooxygenase [Thermoanaerobaculia bacterium]|nr:antibiotic biosynthesis monooxygenase [Thermoanaerobaculia bacterium]
MYLRFVRLKVREGAEAKFVAFYRRRAIPALEATPGCLFVGLLSPWRGEEYQSLTIWSSAEDAEKYEESGLYHRLLRESEAMLSATTRWRIRLAKDPLETAELERREIPPEGYTVEAGAPAEAMTAGDSRLFIRLVSLRIAPDRRQEFLRLYRERVIPALEQREGCRGVMLAEGALDPGGELSISFWDREEDAVRYEMSGEFERLTAELQDTFSPVYSWKLVLGEGGDRRKQAPKVSGYHLVQGREPGEPGS